jgi:hypothetical protein
MGIDERARHDLYLGLEELMGAKRADALMGLLPPVGWADARLHAELGSLLRTLLLGLVGALATMTSLCLAAIALAR